MPTDCFVLRCLRSASVLPWHHVIVRERTPAAQAVRGRGQSCLVRRSVMPLQSCSFPRRKAGRQNPPGHLPIWFPAKCPLPGIRRPRRTPIRRHCMHTFSTHSPPLFASILFPPKDFLRLHPRTQRQPLAPPCLSLCQRQGISFARSVLAVVDLARPCLHFFFLDFRRGLLVPRKLIGKRPAAARHGAQLRGIPI